MILPGVISVSGDGNCLFRSIAQGAEFFKRDGNPRVFFQQEDTSTLNKAYKPL